MRFPAIFAALVVFASPVVAGEQPEGDDPRPARSVFDCQRLSWLENCQSANRQMQSNPDAPVRLMTRNGIEMNFAPGTPTVIMEHQLDPTKESAAKVVDYYERYFNQVREAARLVREVQAERGMDYGGGRLPTFGLDNTGGIDTSPSINYGKVRVAVFFDPNSQSSIDMLQEVSALRSDHPMLSITLFQTRANPAFSKRVESLVGIAPRPLPRGREQAYLDKLPERPAIWIQQVGTNTTKVVAGAVPQVALENALAEASR